MSSIRHLPFRLLVLAMIAAAAIVVVAGCGGSDSSSSSSGETASETTSGGETQESTVSLAGAEFLGKGETGWGIRPAGGAEQEKAEAAGVEAGEEKKQVKLPEGITVGYINYLNGLESGDRLHDSAVLAAAQLGWTVKNCDAKGTPSLFVQCGTSLLAEGVDAIIESGIEAGQLGPVMTKAKAAGVPVVQEGGGGVPQATFAGNYGPNEATAGEILSKALIAKLSEQSGNPEVAIHDFPARWGAERTEVFEKELSEQSKIKIADSVETDPVDPVGFTRSTVTTELTENPNLSAFWVTFDVPGQVAGQTVAQKFPGKEFPEKPLVATFHADHGTVALMAAGAIDMVSEVNYDAAAWMAVDGVAQELAREEQMSQENQPKYPVIGDPFTYQIVTTENLPPEDGYAAPKWDVPSYFIAKWNTEYQK